MRVNNWENYPFKEPMQTSGNIWYSFKWAPCQWIMGISKQFLTRISSNVYYLVSLATDACVSVLVVILILTSCLHACLRSSCYWPSVCGCAYKYFGTDLLCLCLWSSCSTFCAMTAFMRSFRSSFSLFSSWTSLLFSSSCLSSDCKRFCCFRSWGGDK